MHLNVVYNNNRIFVPLPQNIPHEDSSSFILLPGFYAFSRAASHLLNITEVVNMTNKQWRFADEYLIDCNATRAYKAAYPRIKKDATAQALGSRLLSNAMVSEYIDRRMKEISSEKIADAKEVMQYLTTVMRGQSKAEIVVVENIGDYMSEARRVNKAPDEKEKLKAAELIGKRYRMFTENVSIDGGLQLNFYGENSLED